MTRTKQTVLILKLATDGLDPFILPGFVRSLAKSVVVYPHMNLIRMDRKLHYLGWSGHKLDHHAFQLALDDIAEADFDDHELTDQIFHPYFHNA
ncbi:MAG: hypothetical protein PHV70_07015 [Desulfobacteraceae bacterium]|nr:hypothetical protein [Desulfobacteraceae bacterium]